MKIELLKELLLDSYSKDLCYTPIKSEWNKANKYLGMCDITSLIVNDYFKGEIAKIKVDGISHYFNIIDNEIIDLTSSQFNKLINYENYTIVPREKVFSGDTEKRYLLLKRKID